MGGATWLAAPAGVLSLVLMSSMRGGRKGKGKGKKDEGGVSEEEGGVSFTCERVCTSDQLLTRLGGLTKVRRQSGTGVSPSRLFLSLLNTT